MSWLAISDGRHTLRAPARAATQDGGLIARGSLMIETLFPADTGSCQSALELDRTDGWRRRLSVTIGPGGRLRVTHLQGNVESGAELVLHGHDRDAVLRLVYSWDAPSRIGWLSAEDLVTRRSERVVFSDPLPLPIADAAAAVRAGDHLHVDPAVAMVAVSDKVEPIGLSGGLCATTPIVTDRGAVQAGSLTAGDMVSSLEGGLQPVRHVLTRELPAVGHLAPIALRAPYFGLERTIHLAPDHRLMIEGADAEYLFGTAAVLVEAKHLAHLAGARRLRPSATMYYTHVVLDHHDCLSLAGAWGESLYLGDLRECPELLAASPLARIPAAEIPWHGQTAGPPLKPYEAMVLVSAMCA